MPEELQLGKCSSRMGRVTFATLAMNNGVSAEATASVATKHWGPKTLLGYVVPNENLLMQAALKIGKIIITNIQ